MSFYCPFTTGVNLMVNTSKIFILQCFIALDRHIHVSQRESLCLCLWFLMLSNNSAHSQPDAFCGSFSTKFPKVLHRQLWNLHWVLQILTADLGTILSILVIPKSLLQAQSVSAFFVLFFFYKRLSQVLVSYNKPVILLLPLLLFIE